MYDDKLVYWGGFEDKVDIDPTTGKPVPWVAVSYSVFDKDSFTNQHGRFDQTKLRLISIDTGWYNLPVNDARIGMAVLIQRRAHRQNFKGLSNKTHSAESAFIGVSTWRNKNALHHGLVWDHGPVVQALINPVYYSLDQAMDLIGDKRSVALNKDFAICVSHISKYRVLLLSRFGSYVGAIDGRNIVVYHPGSKQEVSDYVKRTNADYQVTDAIYDPNIILNAVKPGSGGSAGISSTVAGGIHLDEF